jgi:PadR family transcriptional regulator PadR
VGLRGNFGNVPDDQIKCLTIVILLHTQEVTGSSPLAPTITLKTGTLEAAVPGLRTPAGNSVPIRRCPARARPLLLLTLQRKRGIFYAMAKGTTGDPRRSEVLQGTLDLLILKTLHALGPMHGYGIARRIEQLSKEVLQLNEGTVYTSLLRLQQQGSIASAWGASENNRKARFYSITKHGLKQLRHETENWERISGVIGRVLRLQNEG